MNITDVNIHFRIFWNYLWNNADALAYLHLEVRDYLFTMINALLSSFELPEYARIYLRQNQSQKNESNFISLGGKYILPFPPPMQDTNRLWRGFCRYSALYHVFQSYWRNRFHNSQYICFKILDEAFLYLSFSLHSRCSFLSSSLPSPFLIFVSPVLSRCTRQSSSEAP